MVSLPWPPSSSLWPSLASVTRGVGVEVALPPEEPGVMAPEGAVGAPGVPAGTQTASAPRLGEGSAPGRSVPSGALKQVQPQPVRIGPATEPRSPEPESVEPRPGVQRPALVALVHHQDSGTPRPAFVADVGRGRRGRAQEGGQNHRRHGSGDRGGDALVTLFSPAC